MLLDPLSSHPFILPSLPPFCNNSFIKAISMHTTHFSHLKPTDPWFSVYSESFSHHHSQFENILITAQRKPIPISRHSPFPLPVCPQPLAATLLCLCSDRWASSMVAFSLWCMPMMWLPRSPWVFVHQRFRNHQHCPSFRSRAGFPPQSLPCHLLCCCSGLPSPPNLNVHPPAV